LSRLGWYSGDIHIHHLAPETCRSRICRLCLP
jgi:hypothetical protein